MRLINRFRQAVQAGRHAAAEGPEGDATQGRTVAALVIGAEPQKLVAAEAWLRAAQAGRAILITDQTEVRLFQLPGIVTEFLPTGARGNPDPSRRHYVERRLAIILSKWEVTRYAAIGPEAEELMAIVAARGGVTPDLPLLRRVTAS